MLHRPSPARLVSSLVSRLISIAILTMPLLAAADTKQPSSAAAVEPPGVIPGDAVGAEAHHADTASSGRRPSSALTQADDTEKRQAKQEPRRRAKKAPRPAAAPGQHTESPAAPKSADAARDARASARALERADQTVDGLELAAHAAQRRLRFAREQLDLTRVRCLDGMLSRLHMATRQGRQMRARLMAALRSNDARLATLEQTRIASLHARQLRLSAQTRICGRRALDVRRHTTEIRHQAPTLPPAAQYPKRSP